MLIKKFLKLSHKENRGNVINKPRSSTNLCKTKTIQEGADWEAQITEWDWTAVIDGGEAEHGDLVEIYTLKAIFPP